MHAETAVAVAAPRYTRANPFPARMVVNRRLSGPESAKDTRHFELDLTGWGLSFEVGDSLAIYRVNEPSRSVVARLQHHPANAQVFESHCAAGLRRAYVELPSRSRPQTGSRDLPLGHGNNRFHLGTSFCPFHAAGVRRATDKITAATLFSGLKLKRVPRSSALHRGRRPLRK